MASAEEYAARLRVPGERGEPRDPYAGAVGTIRGLTYRGFSDDEFRREVIAVLDAAEQVSLERLAATRRELGPPAPGNAIGGPEDSDEEDESELPGLGATDG